MIPPFAPIKSSRQSVKTSFALSPKGIEDLTYITEKMEMTARGLLDFLCSELVSTRQNVPEDRTFLSLTLASIGTEDAESFLKKSVSVSQESLMSMKKLTLARKVKRDLLIDSSIRTYRQLVDYTHPVAVDELKKLRALLDDMNSLRLLERNGIFLHDFYATFEFRANDTRYDYVTDYISEFNAEVKSMCQRVLGPSGE